MNTSTVGIVKIVSLTGVFPLIAIALADGAIEAEQIFCDHTSTTTLTETVADYYPNLAMVSEVAFDAELSSR